MKLSSGHTVKIFFLIALLFSASSRALSNIEIMDFNGTHEVRRHFSIIQSNDDKPPKSTNPYWSKWTDQKLDKNKSYWLRTTISNPLDGNRSLQVHLDSSFRKPSKVLIFNEATLLKVLDLKESTYRINLGAKLGSNAFNLSLAPKSRRTILIQIKESFQDDFPIILSVQEKAQEQRILRELRMMFILAVATLCPILLLVASIYFRDILSQVFAFTSLILLAASATFLGLFEVPLSLYSVFWQRAGLVVLLNLATISSLQYYRYSHESRAFHPYIFNGISLAVVFLTIAVIFIDFGLWPSVICIFLSLLLSIFLSISDSNSHGSISKQLLTLKLLSLLVSIGLASIGSNAETSLIIFLVASLITDIYKLVSLYQSKWSEAEKSLSSLGNEIVPSSSTEGEKNPTLALAQEQTLQEFRMASLGTLTNGLAHELNNPLAVIAGHQFRINSSIRTKTLKIGDLKKSLDKIAVSVKRVLSVIDALRAYSKDSISKEETKSNNVRETIQFALDLCRERLNSYGVKLTTQPIPDTFITCNQPQIMQVILVIIDNALDAVMNEDHKSISIEYKQSVTQVHISITNNGPLIPLSERTHLFDPFFTSKNRDDRKGLGLSIARGIIENHQGKIFLKPNHPETCFVIELNR